MTPEDPGTITPDDPIPTPMPDENLNATFNAESYTFSMSTVSLKATITRTDGEPLTDEDKSGWTLGDDSGFLVPTGTPSITNKGVLSISATRNEPLNLSSGSSTIKLMREGATYSTTVVNYSPYASITTDSTDKLTTDGAETVTALKVNSVTVDINDYTITSNNPEIATVAVSDNTVTITPNVGGKATFAVSSKNDSSKSVNASITFYEPAAKVGDTYYKTLSNAFKAVQSGGTVTLQGDVTEAVNFTGVAPRVADFEVTFDLNGYTLTAPATSSYALRVDYGTVTLKDSVGTGGIAYGKDYAIMVGHLAGDYPSKLIIENGNYTGKTSVAQVGLPGGSGANYKYYGGDLVIKGGTFTAVPDTNETYDENGNYKYLLNMLDMNASNYAGGIYSPSSISVEGGKFQKFNPADCAAEGAHTNFVAEGYQSTKNGDWYEVTAV